MSRKAALPLDRLKSTEVQEKTPHEYSFVRLGAGKAICYEIRFQEEQATVPNSKGLWMAEFLLKQPGKPASPSDLNKACNAGASALVHTRADDACDGYTADNLRPEEPASPEDIAQAKALLEKKQQWLREAEEAKNETRAKREEQEMRQMQEWIMKQQRLQRRLKRGRPATDSPSEKARKRWANNLNRAITWLREAGMPKLAKHLQDHIRSSRGAWVYLPDPAITWHFNENG
jgi:hypothetical protein